MLSKNMEKKINEQINAEMFSGYLYLSMAAYFEEISLSGFANWMRVQAQEELAHAMIFFNHTVERGGRVILDKIEKPEYEWASPLAIAEAVLAHEEKVTSLINNLVSAAEKENDRASLNFLQWFVGEQVEEENNARDMVAKLKMCDNAPQAVLFLDAEMGKRVFNLPSPLVPGA